MCKSEESHKIAPASLPAASLKRVGDDEDEFGVLQDEDATSFWPSAAEAAAEAKRLACLAGPMVATGMLVYLRSLISMLFLGRLGELELAGGSLAIGFANISGYSLLSGLAMGMEPICGQAFGAGRPAAAALAARRCALLLLLACLPVAAAWLRMSAILRAAGQEAGVTAAAQQYLLFALPDLPTMALLHPLRIYLRTQRVTLPISAAAAAALTLHLPLNLLLVTHLNLGIRGVAAAASLTNLNLLLFLSAYVALRGPRARGPPLATLDCLRGWGPLLRLAIPSAASVCLEWWWYELMIMLSGLLVNARSAVAAMGVLIQTTALLYIFPSSLGQAVSTRVGNELGARRPRAARLAAHVGMAAALALAAAALAFALRVRHAWGAAFTPEPAVRRLVALALPVLGAAEVGNCPQTTGCGVLRGTARPALAARINLGSFYLVGMPLALALAFAPARLGFIGLWLGLLAAQASCVALMLVAIARTDWQQQALRAQQLVLLNSNNNAPSDSPSSCSSSSSDDSSPKCCFQLRSSFSDVADESESEESDEEAATRFVNGKPVNGGPINGKTVNGEAGVDGEETVPLISVKVVRGDGGE